MTLLSKIAITAAILLLVALGAFGFALMWVGALALIVLATGGP